MIIEPSPAKAIAHVQSGQRVFIHGSAATPSSLYAALLDRAEELRGVEVVAISTLGEVNWNRPSVREHIHLKSLFVSANVREWVDHHGGDYVPVFLSEIPALFREGWLPVDVAVLQVSPPDAHGYCSLGTSIDAALTAARHAKLVIAQINPRMPRTLGDSHIHKSKIHVAIEESRELPEVSYGAEADASTEKIGRFVAELVEDGSCLQMGIGAIPDSVLRFLTGHKDLGIHTEMFSDGVIPLVEKGVITNAQKKVEPGKIVTTFVLGTRKVYDFVHDNPFVSFVTSAGSMTRRSSARISRPSRSTARSRSISPVRSARTPSARRSSAASAGRWTSCAAHRSARAANRSSRCPPPRRRASRASFRC